MPHPAPVWEDADDRKALVAPGFQLVFRRVEDRWIHRLEGSGARTLACPIEADPARDGPASIVSPVYQEIHPHDLGDGGGNALCVLLTGRLFDHHFSAVVTLSIAADSVGGVVIDWDAADRCRSAVAHLAATYILPMTSGDVADADEHRIRWEVGPQRDGGILEFLAGPPELVALAEAGPKKSSVQAVARIEPGGFTHRLRYRWRWTPSADPDLAS